MSYEINWHMTDHRLLKDPIYQKYSTLTLAQVVAASATIKTDMKAVLMNKDNAPIVSFLSWLLRCAELAS